MEWARCLRTISAPKTAKATVVGENMTVAASDWTCRSRMPSTMAPASNTTTAPTIAHTIQLSGSLRAISAGSIPEQPSRDRYGALLGVTEPEGRAAQERADEDPPPFAGDALEPVHREDDDARKGDARRDDPHCRSARAHAAVTIAPAAGVRTVFGDTPNSPHRRGLSVPFERKDTRL